MAQKKDVFFIAASPDVITVEQNFTFTGGHDAREYLDQCGLARSVRPEYGDGFPLTEVNAV
jgi:hypothetical protein